MCDPRGVRRRIWAGGLRKEALSGPRVNMAASVSGPIDCDDRVGAYYRLVSIDFCDTQQFSDRFSMTMT